VPDDGRPIAGGVGADTSTLLPALDGLSPEALVDLAAEALRLLGHRLLVPAVPATPAPAVPSVLLTPEQVAHRLGVPRQRVYALVRSRDLPSLRFGKHVRIDPADLARWETAHAAHRGHVVRLRARQ
jgi:excisionase family DNA binding protein